MPAEGMCTEPAVAGALFFGSPNCPSHVGHAAVSPPTCRPRIRVIHLRPDCRLGLTAWPAARLSLLALSRSPPSPPIVHDSDGPRLCRTAQSAPPRPGPDSSAQRRRFGLSRASRQAKRLSARLARRQQGGDLDSAYLREPLIARIYIHIHSFECISLQYHN